ncbi:MAG: hypothetical protein PUC18_13150 [Prevotellaceae bacterium]|nr:hypothetical protein [Prevotellaceae bacterium]
MANLHKVSSWNRINDAWCFLDEDQKVDMLCELYNDLTCAQKDEFLRETGNN